LVSALLNLQVMLAPESEAATPASGQTQPALQLAPDAAVAPPVGSSPLPTVGSHADSQSEDSSHASGGVAMIHPDAAAATPAVAPSVLAENSEQEAASVGALGGTQLEVAPPAQATGQLVQPASANSSSETDGIHAGEGEPVDAEAASNTSRAPGKIFEKLKGKVTENETLMKGVGFVVDKSVAVGQTVVDKSIAVGQNERVQQSVEFVKKKTTELAESEKLQKGLDMAKETAKTVSEKTQQGFDYAKEKTKAMRDGANTVWAQGRGSIQKVRSSVGNKLAWKGSARDTLDMAAREEQWMGIKVQGAEEISVPARTEHTSAYHVARGCTLRWTFRVKDYDIGFGVRVRVQVWGGSKEEEVLPVERYDNVDTVSGSWVADADRTMVLAFDNRYSKLRSKTVAYIVGIERPPVSIPAPQEEVGASSSSTPLPVETPPAVQPVV